MIGSPLRELPEVRAEDLGLIVTVCIAAIANDKCIVTASDSKASIGYSSADANVVKYEEFHEHWVAMIAGEDVSHFIPIRDLASEKLKGKPNTLRSVTQAFKAAYKQHLSEVAADAVLGHLNMDIATFKKGGPKRFTSDVYGAFHDQLSKVKLHCTFLAFGYDKEKRPHIFVVEHPGTVRVLDKPGFWAIGSGQISALGMLFHLNQSVDTPVFFTMYNVLAAKFFSERASDVGKHTVFYVKKFGYDAFSRPANLEAEMRAAWEEEGAPRMPKRILTLAQGIGDSLVFWSSRKPRNQKVRDFFNGTEKPKP